VNCGIAAAKLQSGSVLARPAAAPVDVTLLLGAIGDALREAKRRYSRESRRQPVWPHSAAKHVGLRVQDVLPPGRFGRSRLSVELRYGSPRRLVNESVDEGERRSPKA
jgi:hypothetical protein